MTNFTDHLDEPTISNTFSKVLTYLVILVKQESKPHSSAVTSINVNQANELLVTGGEDNTVFVYRLQDTGQLSPLGYLQLTGPARCLTWTPDKVINAN